MDPGFPTLCPLALLQNCSVTSILKVFCTHVLSTFHGLGTLLSAEGLREGIDEKFVRQNPCNGRACCQLQTPVQFSSVQSLGHV